MQADFLNYGKLSYLELVADREMGECVDPEGNGVSLGKGAEKGLVPPSEEQDKQLICNSCGDKTPMGEPGGQQDGSDATSRTHHAQSM
jgi:hypothetical protein